MRRRAGRYFCQTWLGKRWWGQCLTYDEGRYQKSVPVGLFRADEGIGDAVVASVYSVRKVVVLYNTRL